MVESRYRSRMSRNQGYLTREVRLSLKPEEMERFILICQTMEWTMSKLASGIVAEYIRSDMAKPIAVDDADARYLAAWGKGGSEW